MATPSTCRRRALRGTERGRGLGPAATRTRGSSSFPFSSPGRYVRPSPALSFPARLGARRGPFSTCGRAGAGGARPDGAGPAGGAAQRAGLGCVLLRTGSRLATWARGVPGGGGEGLGVSARRGGQGLRARLSSECAYVALRVSVREEVRGACGPAGCAGMCAARAGAGLGQALAEPSGPAASLLLPCSFLDAPGHGQAPETCAGMT